MVKTDMDLSKNIVKLKVNFKTLEDFKSFKEYGIQELSMSEDLQANIIENDSESPFYGIYFGDKLVARMSVYQVSGKYNRYFDPPVDYIEIWKLGVLPDYQGRGYGTALVNFAKNLGMPIKTNPRVKSRSFWEKMGFNSVNYDMERDLGENPLIWAPDHVTEAK
ncbi:N-acetyltransferase [Niallia sp. XMNu-256]|uniref:N-acetyltransferase n=1 Tax=Niallia sp. XMNu-256 TaxID=3082444 RepID=UPI0030CE7385